MHTLVQPLLAVCERVVYVLDLNPQALIFPVLLEACSPCHPSHCAFISGWHGSKAILQSTANNSCNEVRDQVRLRTKVLRAPSLTRPGFKLRHPDHDSSFYVTETPALTTWPSVTS